MIKKKNRNHKITIAALNGETYQNLADKYKLTPERIRQIVNTTIRVDLGSPDFLEELPGEVLGHLSYSILKLRGHKKYLIQRIRSLTKY